VCVCVCKSECYPENTVIFLQRESGVIYCEHIFLSSINKNGIGTDMYVRAFQLNLSPNKNSGICVSLS